MTTFTTVTKAEVLKAAEWIIREGEARLGRPFVLWDAAQQEIDYCDRQQYPVDADIDYWEEQKALVPTPPKMGIKIVGRHRILQVEDLFHWTLSNGDEWRFSDEDNYIKYRVAITLTRLIHDCDCDDEVFVVEIVDWTASTGIYQQLIDDARHKLHQGHQRRRRPSPRRRRGGTTTTD